MEIAAIVISIGAFLWSVGWSVWQHRATTRPQVAVRGSFLVLALDTPLRGFEIRGVNTGSVPVTLTNAFAEVRGAARHVVFTRFIMQNPSGLARLVQPGEHWLGVVTDEEFRRGIAEAADDLPLPWPVRVGVTDAAGKSYRSDWFEVRRS